MPMIHSFIDDEQDSILQTYKGINRIKSNDKAIPHIINTLVKKDIVEEKDGDD